jgi:regulator of nucleoside diphosphate kinase
MQKRSIYITTFDFHRLLDLIDAYRNSDHQKKVHIDELEAELETAQVVDAKQIPADVVTMNSTINLKDLATEEEITLTLVFPKDANVEEQKISVMAPVGMALLGYRVGDLVEWKMPGGWKKFQITATLFQPEASGRYDL